MKVRCLLIHLAEIGCSSPCSMDARSWSSRAECCYRSFQRCWSSCCRVSFLLSLLVDLRSLTLWFVTDGNLPCTTLVIIGIKWLTQNDLRPKARRKGHQWYSVSILSLPFPHCAHMLTGLAINRGSLRNGTFRTEVVRLYAEALRYGTKYIYQALPRMLTIWLEMSENPGIVQYVKMKAKEFVSLFLFLLSEPLIDALAFIVQKLQRLRTRSEISIVTSPGSTIVSQLVQEEERTLLEEVFLLTR